MERFFVVGAPKCGTTALCSYLRAHPAVSFCRVKEPHYFSDDINWQAVHSRQEYDALFCRPTADQKYYGEGSVFYLYSPTAITKALAYAPHAKFIAIVRNPIELVQGMHAENRKAGWEEYENLEDAWAAQDARKAHPKKRNPHSFYYGDLAKTGEQLERAISVVGRENIHIIVYDDFVRDPLDTYQRTLAFLGLPYDGKTDFAFLNTSNQYKNMFLNRLIVAASDIIGLRSPLYPCLSRVARWVRKFNLKNNGKLASTAFKKQLADYFSDDVARLERILNRDLKSWLSLST
jgi:hypothetical protein